MHSPGRFRFLRSLSGALVLTACLMPGVDACTIFVLTDTHRTLFCNNEDWSNPKTRIWFVPAGEGRLGCGYLGFDNGFPQGGLNAKGLAFDWVAGFSEKWEPSPNMKRIAGNPTQRMLETCASVEEAIAFFRMPGDYGFSRAKILVADRTGTSAIIGAKDGRLQIEPSNRSRGFGYGRQTLDEMLPDSEPTVANGARILRTCLQQGPYATKYSNIFDLQSGNIFIFRFPDQPEEVRLNLAAELHNGTTSN